MLQVNHQPSLRQFPAVLCLLSLFMATEIFADTPEPREIKVHDTVIVIVDEHPATLNNSRFNRNRDAASDAPQKTSLEVAQGISATQYRVAATVVDKLPNGMLILEGRRSIRTNNELCEYKITGRIRSADVLADNTALSENVTDLYIVKKLSKVRDRSNRGFFANLHDWLPF